MQCIQSCRIEYCVLKHYQAINVEHAFDFVELSVLMLKQASLTIWAVQLFIESGASLRFIFVVVDWRGLPHQFMVTMRELAFVSIATVANLDPILAHLCLVFCFIDLLHLS